MSTPLISVVMPVHNGMPHLPQAIESILSQSLGDFEFIGMDDGSNDASPEVMAAVQDPRWRWVRSRRQQGLSVTLNRGLRMARGNYWARMDADDISLPRRLELQAAYLDNHPEVSLVGTWAKTLGLPKEQTWKMPAAPEALRAEMLFNSALVHSSVMLRRQDFAQARLRYSPAVARAQDYELWERAARKLQLANLPKVLLRYRIHAGQVGHTQARGQAHTAATVRARQLQRLKLGASPRELKLHNDIAVWQFASSSVHLRRVESWLRTLAEANQRTPVYDVAALAAVLEQRWWAACRAALASNPEAWSLYRTSPLAAGGGRSLADKAIFWLKTQVPR